VDECIVPCGKDVGNTEDKLVFSDLGTQLDLGNLVFFSFIPLSLLSLLLGSVSLLFSGNNFWFLLILISL
jgi:hypothetical protein